MDEELSIFIYTQTIFKDGNNVPNVIKNIKKEKVNIFLTFYLTTRKLGPDSE